jgi:hypothetical protein
MRRVPGCASGPSALRSQFHARDTAQAIERAIKEYDMPERDRWRISVQREA